MIDFSVGDICAATQADLVAGDRDIQVEAVTIDSRKAGPKSLFVGFKGERVDGNAFVVSAAEAGAAAVVMTRQASAAEREALEAAGCALMRAADDDATEFLLRLAGAWRARNAWKVVGVTGSVGKTTTKDMLSAALSVKYRTHATAGNYNNLIGLPLTLLSASADDEVVVSEMGMNHPGEIARMSACARPEIAVITNVGTSHIGLLGSRQNIARAKAEIVSGMQGADGASAVLYLGADNDFGTFIADRFARPAGVEVSFVGSTDNSVVEAHDVTLSEDGYPTVTLVFADGHTHRITLSTPGRQVVGDLLFAMAVADRLGVDRDEAADAVASMPQTHMRLEVTGGTGGHPRVIDDSYNASPSSMAAALDVLREMSCTGRRIAVLGDIGELGDESDRLHGYVGAYAAATHPDLLVLVGTSGAAQMSEAALTMGYSADHLETFATSDAALRVIGPILDENDLVLVKASRAVGLDAFVRGVLA